MTSVSALICNVKKGPQIWIADELETLGDIRQSSISDKLYHIGNIPYCVGGAGSVPLIKRTMEDVCNYAAKEEVGYAKDMENVIKTSYMKNYIRMREEAVMKPNGTTWDEWKTGRLKENSALTGKILEQLNRFDDRNMSRFLGGGKLAKDEEYRLSQVSVTDVTGEQYYSIGSGMLRADAILSDYLERMKSEERKDIPAPLGVRMLIEATQSARSMPGVGGTGQIVYLNEDGFNQLSSDEVRLLHNLVFDEKTKLVKKNFVDKTIEGIMNKETDVKEVLKKLETRVNPKKLLKEHYTGRLQRY